MGKKRPLAAQLSKVYSSAPTSSSTCTHSTLSVADKLSKLRIEGLRHERNIAGHSENTSRSQSAPAHSNTPSQVTPDVSQLLGQQFVEPQSRVKPRNRGHLAPRSWNQPIRQNKVTSMKCPERRVHAGSLSLVDLCLCGIIHNIHDYLDSGMNLLPAYMKARLLASLISANDDIVWNDIVPEEDDEVEVLDLSLTKPSMRCLRRLTGLRSVTLSISQVESALVSALPSVLQELIIRPVHDVLHTQSAQKAYWRRLSSHFIALKVIRLDLRNLDIHSQIGLDVLLGALLEGPDWREAFDTVSEVTFVARDEADSMTLSSSLPFFGFKGSLRKLRRKGRHVECRVVSSPREQIS